MRLMPGIKLDLDFSLNCGNKTKCLMNISTDAMGMLTILMLLTGPWTQPTPVTKTTGPTIELHSHSVPIYSASFSCKYLL